MNPLYLYLLAIPVIIAGCAYVTVCYWIERRAQTSAVSSGANSTPIRFRGQDTTSTDELVIHHVLSTIRRLRAQ